MSTVGPTKGRGGRWEQDHNYHCWWDSFVTVGVTVELRLVD
jgi:hypothetical protein